LKQVCDWLLSTFQRRDRQGLYPPDWDSNVIQKTMIAGETQADVERIHKADDAHLPARLRGLQVICQRLESPFEFRYIAQLGSLAGAQLTITTKS